MSDENQNKIKNLPLFQASKNDHKKWLYENKISLVEWIDKKTLQELYPNGKTNTESATKLWSESADEAQ